MNIELNNFKKKIIYKTKYRGTKEMDMMLGKLTAKIIDNANFEQLIKLEEFLSINDTTINDWINNPNNIPQKYEWIFNYIN